MKEICDVFLHTPLIGSAPLLQRLVVFQKDIVFDESKTYSGFLGLNISRTNAVAVIMRFRSKGAVAVSVPVRYRDERLLSQQEADEIVSKAAVGLSLSSSHSLGLNPMFFEFCDNKTNDARFNIVIDRLDGHIWTSDEVVEYQYDFNNLVRHRNSWVPSDEGGIEGE